MKKKYFLTTLLSLILYPFVSLAQTPVYKEATLAQPAEFWKPLKVGDNESNVLNGVQFYVHNSDCGNGKVKLLKLINLNAYQVKFNYQTSPNSPLMSVLISSLTSLEGSCSATNENLLKLVLIAPDKKNETENKEMKKFLLSHITVSKQ